MSIRQKIRFYSEKYYRIIEEKEESTHQVSHRLRRGRNSDPREGLGEESWLVYNQSMLQLTKQL